MELERALNQITHSSYSSSITNACSPFNNVNLYLSGCLRCNLREPIQFLVIWFKLVSIGLEQSILRSMFIWCKRSRCALRASLLLKFKSGVKAYYNVKIPWITWVSCSTISSLGSCGNEGGTLGHHPTFHVGKGVGVPLGMLGS